MVTTIDCTPTWEGILRYYIAILQDGNAEGQKAAKHELQRMAKAADQFNELNKEIAKDEPLMNKIKALLICSFQDKQFSYAHLSKGEKSIVSEEEFAEICQWLKG